MSDNKELVFDILDLTVDSCYLDILEHFASELMEYVLEYFYVLELLIVYSEIIEKTSWMGDNWCSHACGHRFLEV